MPSCSSDLMWSGMSRKAAPTARALKVGVDAEAREAGDRVGEVDLPARLEHFCCSVERIRYMSVRISSGVSVVVIRQALEAALDANHRRRAGGQVEVGRVVLDHHGEQIVDRVKFRCHRGFDLSSSKSVAKRAEGAEGARLPASL